MIDLSIDISYLSRYFGITPTATTAGVPEAERNNPDMMTIKTEDGQITVDRKLLLKLLEKPEKLAKILNLIDPNNRFLIIKEFNEDDLTKLLPFLSSNELAMGLQFFTLAGLDNLLCTLPTEELVNLLLLNFTMEDVTPFMQENEMNEFFTNPNLDKNDVMEYFKGMEAGKLQKLMSNQFGQEYQTKSPKECIDFISSMEDSSFQKFLLGMQGNEKRDAIAGLCTINPDYYLEFDNSILTRPMMTNLEKGKLIENMATLDEEFLVPMVEELPKDLIQIVATQIDPTVFSKILSTEFPDLIVEMLAG